MNISMMITNNDKEYLLFKTVNSVDGLSHFARVAAETKHVVGLGSKMVVEVVVVMVVESARERHQDGGTCTCDDCRFCHICKLGSSNV